jgi:hypothetical protein
MGVSEAVRISLRNRRRTLRGRSSAAQTLPVTRQVRTIRPAHRVRPAAALISSLTLASFQGLRPPHADVNTSAPYPPPAVASSSSTTTCARARRPLALLLASGSSRRRKFWQSFLQNGRCVLCGTTSLSHKYLGVQLSLMWTCFTQRPQRIAWVFLSLFSVTPLHTLSRSIFSPLRRSSPCPSPARPAVRGERDRDEDTRSVSY